MSIERRLIDANALWAEFMELADTSIEFDAEGVANAIANAPTIDAVEVVRCKECKHYDEIKHGYGWCCKCNDRHEYAKDEEYCSFGERREGE